MKDEMKVGEVRDGRLGIVCGYFLDLVGSVFFDLILFIIYWVWEC